jgi:broad specificity phosphatase PhoE
MLRVVLILPGSTDYDQQGRIQGVLNIPLNEQGADEVARVVRELQDLGLQCLYSSPCAAAVETADTIGRALQLRAKPLEQMQNVDHGLWQGMLIDEVRLKQPKVYRQWQEQPETLCPPDGETISTARTRVRAALQRLLKKHKQGTIGLVVPEPLASIVRTELSGVELGDLWEAECSHGKWEIIDVETLAAVPGGRTSS